MKPKGPPPPFGIDPTACYDTRRNRIYMGGGSYPVAKGPNALWVYDVASRHVDRPQAQRELLRRFEQLQQQHCHDDVRSGQRRVVINRHDAEPGTQENGIWVYDPTSNAWEDHPRPFPNGAQWKGQVNAFYDPRAQRPRLPLRRR